MKTLEEMTTAEKMLLLSDYSLTFRKRSDAEAWRLWLNRNSETDFVYICEERTVDDCLDSAITYLNRD